MKALILAVIMSTALTSCEKENVIGSGSTQTELRNVTGFTKIRVEGSTDLTITQGNNFRVEVKAHSNLLPQLETKVVDGTLRIGFKQGTSVANDNSEVAITLPSLAALTASGNSKVDIQSGSADDFETVIMGAADVHAFGFNARHAHVTIEGSGNAEVSVSEKLHAKITGSGNIYYKGNAAVSSNIIGSGKVVKR